MRGASIRLFVDGFFVRFLRRHPNEDRGEFHSGNAACTPGSEVSSNTDAVGDSEKSLKGIAKEIRPSYNDV